VNNFKFIQSIGSGAYGTVIKAIDIIDNSIVAIKKIEFDSISSSEAVREYTNFVTIYQMTYYEKEFLVKHLDGWFEQTYCTINTTEQKLFFYIKMELCDQTLEDIIDQIDSDLNLKKNEILTPLGYYIVSQILIEIVECVNHLHKTSQPIIHRDLKPANILLKRSSEEENSEFVKIADFGLIAIHKFAKELHSIDKGTPKYTAPEVINSDKYDTKADIYSLGIILEKMFDLESER